MTILDANILLYAVDSSSAFHGKAKAFLEAALSGNEIVGIPWESINAFLRISTNHRIWEKPLALEEAVGYVDEWLAQSCVRPVTAQQNHWPQLKDLLKTAQAKGDLVMDAHLASYAKTHDATLISTDRDFSRFVKLRWQTL